MASVSSPPTILLPWALPQLHVSDILSELVVVVISDANNDEVVVLLMPFVMPEIFIVVHCFGNYFLFHNENLPLYWHMYDPDNPAGTSCHSPTVKCPITK